MSNSSGFPIAIISHCPADTMYNGKLKTRNVPYKAYE